MHNSVPVTTWIAGVRAAMAQILAQHYPKRRIEIYVRSSSDTASVTHSVDKRRVHALVEMPRLPLDKALTRQEADAMTAFWLHEIGHVLYTDAAVWRERACVRGSAFKYLCNALEDARQEREVIRASGASNARGCFEALINRFHAKAIAANFNPNRFDSIAWTLAVLGRAQLYSAK